MRNQADRELVQVLIEDPDPTARSAAHRELARRAAARDDLANAVRHYREVALLDPDDASAREALDRLEAELQGGPRRRGVFGRLVRGLPFARA